MGTSANYDIPYPERTSLIAANLKNIQQDIEKVVVKTDMVIKQERAAGDMAAAGIAATVFTEEVISQGIPSTTGTTEGEDLVIRSRENQVDTWLQASAYASDSGVAGPTPAALQSMTEAGMVLASGSIAGDPLVIRSANNGVETWLQASGQASTDGLAGPTPEAVESMAGAGMVRTIFADPTTITPRFGETILCIDDGQATLVIGD